MALQRRGLAGRRGSRHGKLALSVALLYRRRRDVGAVLVDPLDGGRSSRVLNLELWLGRLHAEVVHGHGREASGAVEALGNRGVDRHRRCGERD